MAKTFRDGGCYCPYCNAPQPKFRPKSRHYSHEIIMTKVKQELQNLVKVKGPLGFALPVTREALAEKLKVKIHIIGQCFTQLNLEGWISQGYNSYPHDCSRGPKGNGGWTATRYYLNPETILGDEK